MFDSLIDVPLCHFSGLETFFETFIKNCVDKRKNVSNRFWLLPAFLFLIHRFKTDSWWFLLGFFLQLFLIFLDAHFLLCSSNINTENKSAFFYYHLKIFCILFNLITNCLTNLIQNISKSLLSLIFPHELVF